MTPRTQPIFLTALSSWMLLAYSHPPLSDDPQVEVVEDLLRRRIRHLVRLAPEETRNKNQRQDLTRAMVAKVKLDNSGVSIERICVALDAKGVPLPRPWRNLKLATWHEVWKAARHRPKVKRYVSGIQPAVSEKEQQFLN